MPGYAYRAVDAAGKRVHGRAEAASAVALARSLEERGLLVLAVDSAGSGRGLAQLSFRPSRRKAVLEVTRSLAALLPSGMPLARALVASAHVATPDVGEALAAVRSRVERGESLATALAEHPDFFTPLYVGVVRAGERSGDLACAFARLAAQLEREDELRGRLLSAAIYPMILATVGGLAVIVLLFFVLPRFVDLLQGAGATLPRSTAILLGASTVVRRFWPLLLLVPIAGAAAVASGAGTGQGRRLFGQALLRLPIVRGMRRDASAARFARLVGTLLGGGAPLLSALDDATESLGDPIAREEASRIRARVREGGSLHQAIEEGALFPPLLSQLVAVGEESGRLEEFLLKAADIFEGRTDRTVQRLVSLLEPAMIVVFGAVVAVVALSLLQAIYGVNAGSFR